MKHLASPRFWRLYHALPKSVQELADKNFELLKSDPRHPSLHFKRIGEFHSIRIGAKYRALAIDDPEGLLWYWIGKHPDYDRLIG